MNELIYRWNGATYDLITEAAVNPGDVLLVRCLDGFWRHYSTTLANDGVTKIPIQI